MKRKLAMISAIILLLVLTLNPINSLAAADTNLKATKDDGFIDYLYERGGLVVPFGDSKPTATRDLTLKGSYTASWTSVVNYTYSNVKFCSGASSSRPIKLVMSASWPEHGYALSGAKVTGTVYDSSGKSVGTWSGTGNKPSFTGYFNPSSTTAYYYLKITVTGAGTYSAGKCVISVV